MVGHSSLFIEDERKYEKCTLQNGIQCVFVHDPAQEDVVMRLSVPGGLASDPEDLRGLSYTAMQSCFRGSLNYPGVYTFKNFLIDNEASIEIVSYDFATSTSVSVPEFAFEEFLKRLMDAIEAPVFSSEGIQAVFDHRKATFYDDMNDDLTKYHQITIMALTGEKDYGNAQQKFFKRKDLLSKIQMCHSKNMRSAEMRLYLCSGLPLQRMKEYASQTFGQLLGQEQSVPFTTSSSMKFRWPNNNNTDKIKFVEAFTKNDEKTLYFTFVLPKGCSISSALYLGYLFATSQPGSLQYYWKTEGLAEWIKSSYIYYSSELHTLRIEVSATSKVSKNMDLLLNSFMGFIDIIKRSPPNLQVFNQAREYFTILRNQDHSFMKPDRIFTELQHDRDFTDVFNAEIPRMFDPAEIALVAESMSAKNLLVMSLSNEHTDAKVHPHTDYYLQFSTFGIPFLPSFQNMRSPKYDPLLVGSRQYKVNTRDLVCATQNPHLYLRTLVAQSYCMLKARIDCPDFQRYSNEALKIYAAWLEYKLWLMQVEPVFRVSIKAQAKALCIIVKSVPESTARVFEYVVQELLLQSDGCPDEKLEELKQKALDELDANAEDFFTRSLTNIDTKAMSDSFDIQAQKQCIRDICAAQDLPSFSGGKVSLLLAGNFDLNTYQSCHKLACVLHGNQDLNYNQIVFSPNTIGLQSAASMVSDNEKHHTARLSGLFMAPLLKFKHTRSKRSACVKLFRIGAFTYQRWAASLSIVHVLNNFCQIPRTHSGLISQSCVQAFYDSQSIWLFMGVSGSTFGHALNEFLKTNIADTRSYLNGNSHSVLDNIKAKLKADILNHKEDLDDEVSRLWTPIWANCGDSHYFEYMQRALWALNPGDVQKLCDSAVSCCDTLANTVIFLGQYESKMAFFNLIDVELPLFGLYQPISDLGATEILGTHIPQKRSTECDDSAIDGAIMTERLISRILNEF